MLGNVLGMAFGCASLYSHGWSVRNGADGRCVVFPLCRSYLFIGSVLFVGASAAVDTKIRGAHILCLTAIPLRSNTPPPPATAVATR